jgi:hypothetical protein
VAAAVDGVKGVEGSEIRGEENGPNSSDNPFVRVRRGAKLERSSQIAGDANLGSEDHCHCQLRAIGVHPFYFASNPTSFPSIRSLVNDRRYEWVSDIIEFRLKYSPICANFTINLHFLFFKLIDM